MPRRRAGDLLPLELDILETGLALQSAGGDFHGFLLARHLKAAKGDAALTAHGTLYKALSRMSNAGLLQSEWEDPERAGAEGRPRRRLYTVTGLGEEALARAVANRSAPAPGSGVAATKVQPA